MYPSDMPDQRGHQLNGQARAPDALSDLPRYQRIKHILRHRILSGSVLPGDRLPSEPELARQYGVSRITSGQALGALAAEGLAVRERGRGTFVAHRPGEVRRVAKITGSLEDILRHSRDVSTRLLGFEECKAPADVVEMLGTERADPVWVVTRVRLIDGHPLTFTRTYIQPRWARWLTESLLRSDRTVIELLESRTRLRIDAARQVIQANSADSEIGTMLEVPVGSPVLEVRRLDLSRRHGPIEYVIAYYRADRYAYSVDLVRRVAQKRRVWRATHTDGRHAFTGDTRVRPIIPKTSDRGARK
jgi:GntR family transcriptional regulator